LRIDQGTFTVTGDWIGTLRHEFGHFFESITLNWGTNIYNEYTGLYVKYKDDLPKILSKYAQEDAREFFAEAFSAYTSPDYKTSPVKLPKDIENFLKKLLGK